MSKHVRDIGVLEYCMHWHFASEMKFRIRNGTVIWILLSNDVVKTLVEFFNLLYDKRSRHYIVDSCHGDSQCWAEILQNVFKIKIQILQSISNSILKYFVQMYLKYFRLKYSNVFKIL